MTVSHFFYDNKIIEAFTNFEAYENDPTLEKAYNVEDPGFQEFLQSIALGTKAAFSYTPSLVEMRSYLAVKQGKKATEFSDKILTEEEKQEASQALI